MLLDSRGLVFLGRRRSKPNSEVVAPEFAWQMPQGGIDEGETPLAAARRELAEETGVTRACLLDEAPAWLDYRLPVELVGRALHGRWSGQTQKWFAFRFEGADSDIDVRHVPGGCEPEFDAWRWERMERLPDLVVPFKREVYRAVTLIFSRFAASADSAGPS
jgi:putative (di)nucleoside polyphosphate hydrolase